MLQKPISGPEMMNILLRIEDHGEGLTQLLWFHRLIQHGLVHLVVVVVLTEETGFVVALVGLDDGLFHGWKVSRGHLFAGAVHGFYSG